MVWACRYELGLKYMQTELCRETFWEMSALKMDGRQVFGNGHQFSWLKFVPNRGFNFL